MFVGFLKNDRGATAIEYGLIAVLVALAALGGMQLTGDSVNTMYNDNSDRIIGAMNNVN